MLRLNHKSLAAHHFFLAHSCCTASRIRSAFVRCRLVLAAIAVAACLSHSAHAFTIVITEPQTPLVPNSVLELAQRLGYFKRESVDVEFKRVGGTPLAVAALASGEGDMANISLESLLKLTARGDTDFRAVSSPNKSLSYVIIARKPIASIADLRGKIFGIGQVGTLDNTLSWHVLRKSGLDPAALKVVSVGRPESRLAALVAGKIDATTASFGSWITLPDKAGLHVIVSKEDYFRAAPVVAKVNVVSRETLESKRSAIIKVTAAIIKLSRWFAVEPQRWAKAMAKARPDAKPADLRRLAEVYAHDWCTNGCLEPEELKESARLLYRSPNFKNLRPAPLSDWVDFSVLSAVKRKLSRDAEQ